MYVLTSFKNSLSKHIRDVNTKIRFDFLFVAIKNVNQKYKRLFNMAFKSNEFRVKQGYTFQLFFDAILN